MSYSFMSSLVLSGIGEQSFNKFWSPDPGNLREGPIHEYTPPNDLL